MRHTLTAIVALAFGLCVATSSNAATAAGPYKLDSKGKCHAANGQFAKQALCSAAPAAATPPKHCKDPKTGKFIKCPA
jgi:hypothetical protein